MSTSNLQTPFGNIPLQEKFKISSIFSTGLVAEFDQNVIFMPFENANSLFEISDMDIDLEIFLNKPDKVQLIKKNTKIFTDHYVYSWADLNKSFFGALKVERNVMFII